MATLRDNLKVDTIYKEKKSGQYFYTPDGIGCIWSESLQDLREDTGITARVIVIQELSDF